MGVTGLWRLIEPSGHPVPLQTLDNKVLAVDVSIWLHQAIKGFQNAQGGTIPNAHLLGIYHRICKLLFYGIKPIVIFDGGVPNLKQQIINKRAIKRSKALNEANSIHKQLVSALLKHTAISKILSDESKIKLAVKPLKEKAEDIYKLPPTEFDSTQSDDESSTSTSIDSSPTKHWDLHTIDEKSAHFKALPADVRHDILTDLKETRKQSSWGRLHEMPKKSDDFSGFQMKRLLKRYSVQVSLEEAEKEMGGRSLSLAELEALLNDQGVVTCDSVGKRIASDENKRYLLIKDLKKAMDEAKKETKITNVPEESELDKSSDETLEPNTVNEIPAVENKADEEFEEDLKLAIELSLQDVPSTSQGNNPMPKKNRRDFSFLQDFTDADFPSSSESEEDCTKSSNANKVLESVKNYMVEYSGLTPNEVDKIMTGKIVSNSLEDSANNTKLASNSDDKFHSIPEPQTSELCTKGSSIEKRETANVINTLLSETLVPSNKNDEEKKNEQNMFTEETVNEKSVDIMSDSSDSSNDFVDVSEEPKTNTKIETQNLLEIVIRPEDSADDDDIFRDIFPKKDDTKIPKEDSATVSSKVDLEKLKSTRIINDKKDEISGSSDQAALSQAKEPEQTPLQEEKCSELLKPLQEEESSELSKMIQAEVTTDNTDNLRPTVEQLREIQQDLEDKNLELMTDQLTKERMANSLNEQIVQETQDLLRLFGVPFIVAPMEAEAQCAFLEIINLTDGTITDDSDIWLFGGKTVYKNFFNQEKHVMEFRAESILEHYKLAREQMILLALLVGSDYTLGIQGIGPVTALEILAAFPNPKKLVEINFNYHELAIGLENFRKWLTGETTMGMGRTGLRSKLKNVTINEGFPSVNVIKAYLEPSIDSSNKPFSWGRPNKQGLVEYAKRKFGWAPDKSENILKPLVKKMNETLSQKTIKNYFKTKHKIDGGGIEDKMSKRVKKAVGNIENGLTISEQEDKSAKKRSKPKEKRKSNKKTDTISKEMRELSSDEDVQILKKTQTQTKTKLKQIHQDIKRQVEEVKKPRIVTTAQLHKKEVIPQKQRDKADALRTKMRAIEVLRKSKQGPGYVQPRRSKRRQPKAEAELSESSSD